MSDKTLVESTVIAPPRTRLYVIVSLVIAVLCLLAFLKLVDNVTENEAITVVDVQLGRALNDSMTPALVSFYLLLSYVGGQGSLVAGVAAALWAIWRRQWLYLGFVVVTLVGAGLLNSALKMIFARPRPAFANVFAVEQNASFPSGHAMLSLVTFGLLAYFLFYRDRRLLVRTLIVGITVIFVLLVGISRLALGVHYLSDVLAGYAVGGLWLGACIAAMSVLQERHYRWQETRRVKEPA